MQVIRETLWKRRLSTPTKPLAKNSNICPSETAYQQKGTRKKCKKTNQAAIILWKLQCLMDKPHPKLWPKSKTSCISKQSPSPLHHTFLLGRSRFTAQPLSALGFTDWVLYAPINVMPAEGGGRAWGGDLTFFKNFAIKFPAHGQIIPVKCNKISPAQAAHCCQSQGRTQERHNKNISK